MDRLKCSDITNNKLTNLKCTSGILNVNTDGLKALDSKNNKLSNLTSTNNKLNINYETLPNSMVSIWDGALVYSDSLPQPQVDPSNRDGWLWKKTATGSQKFNYYYYSVGNMPITVKQIKGLNVVLSIDHYANITSLPFLIIYTKPTGVNDHGSWYHSKFMYSMSESKYIDIGELINIWSIKKPTNLSNDFRTVEFNNKTVYGEALGSEEVLSISIHSDSTSVKDTQILIQELSYELLVNNETITKRLQLTY